MLKCAVCGEEITYPEDAVLVVSHGRAVFIAEHCARTISIKEVLDGKLFRGP